MYSVLYNESRLCGEQLVLSWWVRVVASLAVQLNYLSINISSFIASPVYLSIILSSASKPGDTVQPTLLILYSPGQ